MPLVLKAPLVPYNCGAIMLVLCGKFLVFLRSNNILEKTEELHEYGNVKPDLLICLVVVWIIAYFSVWKGIGWTSKVVYFTATTPFVMLIILVARGATLEGAGNGMKEYLNPNAKKLAKLEVWTEAASQVLFSFGICTGGLPTMSMFNRDILIMTVANAVASFLAGVICFTVLGHLAFKTVNLWFRFRTTACHTASLCSLYNTAIADIADKGPGLVFVVYPTAISLFPLPYVWCPLFFITMLLVGLDSLFVYHETLVCSIRDMFPQWFRFRYSNEVWMAITMFALFLFGLTMITPGGIYLLEILNNYAVAGWCLFAIAVLEFIAVGWVYGTKNMCEIIEDMIGYKLGKIRLYFHVMWRYVGPVVSLIFTFYSLSLYRTLKLGSYVYPTWANILGWMTALSSSLTFPIGAVWAIYKAKGSTLKEKFFATIEKNKDMKRPIELDDNNVEEKMLDSKEKSEQ